jgi:imidazolonepropionase-like amidohydrolase
MPESQSTVLVLRNAVIVDGTGADPVAGGSVVVEGDRIREVLPGGPGALPAGAEVLDCRGGTLLPGLIDAHVHVGAAQADITELQRRNFPSYLTVRAARALKDSLDRGFTTVRDCGGADAGLRRAVEEGLIPGPRLNVCGRPLSQTGGHADFRLPTETHAPVESAAGLASVVCDGVDECRRAAREELRRGADFIKVMAGGGAISPSDEVDTSQYSPEELAAIVFEASAVGKYVAAHAYSVRSIANCLRAGVGTIEHGNLLDEAAAGAMKAAGACLVPTIVTYEMLSRMGREHGVPEANIRKINQVGERALEALAIAHRAGVTIGSGSDLLGPMQVFQAGELELQARVMGPMGAIVAATRTNAEILRAEKDLGTVEPGKLADLVLVDGDPLADISVLGRGGEKIALVIRGGRRHKSLL